MAPKSKIQSVHVDHTPVTGICQSVTVWVWRNNGTHFQHHVLVGRSQINTINHLARRTLRGFHMMAACIRNAQEAASGTSR